MKKAILLLAFSWWSYGEELKTDTMESNQMQELIKSMRKGENELERNMASDPDDLRVILEKLKEMNESVDERNKLLDQLMQEK